MAYADLVLVEGTDDLHAVVHTLSKHHVAAGVFDEAPGVVTDRIAVKALGGYGTLHKRLPLELTVGTELRRVGIVVDGDANPERRWASLRDLVRSAGAVGVPETLPKEGWVGEARTPTRTLRVGLWLMPDCEQRGALEEYAAALIPATDALWAYAQTCVEGLPERRFRSVDERKALVHTWLAWQRKPRLAIGEAISAGVLDSSFPSAESFVAWVRRVFDL
jgi:CBS domain-containing protein